MDKRSVLKQYFGHDAFRDGQEPLIDSILAGGDVLGIMPTGSGKSLCYQIPALMLPGITLVISPLISLMKDQVMDLKSAGVEAAFINSSLTSDQLRTVYRNMAQGQYKIVYVAPERLTGDLFISLAQTLHISLVAVDEAHCISQWGQDFRPSYLKITDFIDRLPQRPVTGAFTATATEAVRRDILARLKLRNPLSIVTGFDRPNLFFDVLKPKKKLAMLKDLMTQRCDKSGIVYCATRANTDRVCAFLIQQGFSATRYHAGLSDEERRMNQDDFQFDRKAVMVATNAFGMGIDKSNVGFVIHYNMPKSVEAYYQEAGRAGRDGQPADCLLLYAPGDIATAKFLIQNRNENEDVSVEERELVKTQDLRRLNDMIEYCRTSACLRGYILGYFGQGRESSCGNCGSCSGDFSLQDITKQAQMILSCVKRVKDLLGYSVGASLIVRVLHGSRDKRVKELGLAKLTTYGLLKHQHRSQTNEYVDWLKSQGYLAEKQPYSSLELTDQSQQVLFGGKRVEMPVKLVSPAVHHTEHKKTARSHGEAPPDLMAALKTVRTQLALEAGVPAYVIFSNASLADMADKQPRTPAQFLNIHGVGEKKAARYGEAFLDAIKTFNEGEL